MTYDTYSKLELSNEIVAILNYEKGGSEITLEVRVGEEMRLWQKQHFLYFESGDQISDISVMKDSENHFVVDVENIKKVAKRLAIHFGEVLEVRYAKAVCLQK